MVAQPNRSRMPVEEYLLFDAGSTEARYEFIDGYAYMLTGGTQNHARCSANMIRELGNALRNGPCSVYTSDMRVRLSEKRYVYPDVSVSCDPRDLGTDDILQYPRLIVEILSPSTELYDRDKKASYYRACPTIEEYVLVSTQRRSIEVYHRGQGRFWQFSSFGPDDTIELASLGIRFPIDAIYENVVLPEEPLS